MNKFIVLLVLIFAFFYIGGILLFDSGMSYEISTRVPAAVKLEKFVLFVAGGLGNIFDILNQLIAPIADNVNEM